MSGSSNAAIHVIGSQIEAMNMRIDEIKKKGYAEIQVNFAVVFGAIIQLFAIAVF